ALRLGEMPDEIRVADEIVEPIADVARRIEPEQARRRRVEPQDLVRRVQDDPRIAQHARALPDLAQQPVILLLAAAGLRPDLVDAGEHLGPETARLEARHALLALEDPVEQIDLPEHVREVDAERTHDPPAHAAEPRAEQQRDDEPGGQNPKLRYPALRQSHARSGENP